MNSRLLINIFGPMTAGKSTLADLLQNYLGHVYTVDYDVIKKQISDYSSSRDRVIAESLTYDTLAAVAQTDLNIIALLPPPKNYETYQRCDAIAEETKRVLLNVEVKAPIPVLLSRYEGRTKAIRATNPFAKLRTIEEFEETVSKPYFVPAGTYSLDSSELSPEELLDKVVVLIQ